MPCRMGASFARAPRPRNPQRFSSEHGSTLTRILTRAHTHTHTHTHEVCVHECGKHGQRSGDRLRDSPALRAV